MGPDINQLLSEQLRDIHLPEAVGWWPLAIGWWILIILVVLMVIAGIWAFLWHQNQHRYRKLAITEIRQAYDLWQKKQDHMAFIQTTNLVLKRASAHLPNVPLSLSGQHWAEFLNLSSPGSLDEESLEALATGAYKPNYQTDIEKLYNQSCVWLQKHRIQQGATMPLDAEAGHV